MRKILGTLLILAALVACHAAPPTPSNLLRAELVRLTGKPAKDCGLVTLGTSPDAGWSCAGKADKNKQPFWFAVERRGIDSDIWEAIGRDSNGGRFLLVYDSNPYGSPDLHPRFNRDTCVGEFVFTPSKNAALGCRRHAP